MIYDVPWIPGCHGDMTVKEYRELKRKQAEAVREMFSPANDNDMEIIDEKFTED